MSTLEVRDLYKGFDTQSVLRGVDLSVPAGSFCAILGRSGSGKTTLLRTIAGFERADRGSVALDGSVVEDGEHRVPPERRAIGYVPQEGSLFPHLSVTANVAFGLRRAERRSARVGELLELVGLLGYERRYPHQLSGGQQQRVVLARALAVRPALVLLDEPFSSLDATLRAEVRRDVRRVLAERDTTAVLVTHDQDEALSLSDQVAVLADGRIGQVDTPRGIYAHPSNAALAAGVGDANFLTGRVGIGAAIDSPLGRLAPESPPTATDVLVLVRPEQLVLSAPTGTGATGRVVDREYYGHDAIVRVRGEWSPETTLLARVVDTEHLPEPGERVGIAVRGPVVAWAREDAGETS